MENESEGCGSGECERGMWEWRMRARDGEWRTRVRDSGVENDSKGWEEWRMIVKEGGSGE